MLKAGLRACVSVFESDFSLSSLFLLEDVKGRSETDASISSTRHGFMSPSPAADVLLLANLCPMRLYNVARN